MDNEVKIDTKEEIKVLELFGGIGAIRKAFERQNIPHKVVDYVEIDEFAVKSYNAMFGTNFEPQDISKWDKDIEVDFIMHGSPCFVAGTKIKTIDGFKNIEDIQVEDMVLTHTNTYQKVLKVGHNENKQIWELKSEDSDNITLVTGNHPFYIYTNEGNYKWKEIQYVTKSDKLCKIINNDIKHFAVISLTPTETYTTVYNIEVENDNSYTANGYIVHNCQDFSIASNQEGGDEGSGTRSSLMYETLRIVDKLKPKYVIWENVANLLSKKHRPNFEKYLDIMDELGYNNYYQVLNAKDYGIPQNRKRVFTVSIRKDIDKKKFHFKPKQKLKLTLKDLLETNVDEKYYLSDEKIASISQWKAYQKPLESVLGNNSISPTLTARGAGEEHAGMITYSDKFDTTTNVQNLLLNKNTEGVSNTLTTVQKDTYVLEEDTRNKKQQLCDYMVENDLVEPYDVINHGYTKHRFKNIKANKDIVLSKNILPTLMTRPDELGVAVNSNQEKIQNTSGLRIRKLTPKECWRLMGFDDKDFEKAAEVCTEAQLYKQAGNSIVVNTLEKICVNLFMNNKVIEYRIYRHHSIIDNIERGLLEKKEIDENGNANVDFWTTNCSLFLTIENYKEFKDIISTEKFENGQVNQSAVRLLEICLIKATEEGFTTENAKQIDIDISEIMLMLNKNVDGTNGVQQIKDDLKKQIRKDLQILKNVKIKFRTKTGEFVGISILESTTKLKKDILHFVLNDTLNKILKDEGKDISLPSDILLFNEKYEPNVYLTYKKLLSELKANDEVKINVNDIYKYCITLPRIEEVKKTNRAYTQRIRAPLEKALNLITEFNWKYENKLPVTFKEWLDSNIIVKRKEVSNKSKVA